MAVHRIHLDERLADGGGFTLEVGGEEGWHAVRVKRVLEGHRVMLLDGRGGIGQGRVERIKKGKREATLVVRVDRVKRVEPDVPRVEVWSSTPKGPRAGEMVDGLSQVGAAAWVALTTERTVVDPREGKLDKLARVAAEASKQCGRAWTMEVGDRRHLREALDLSASDDDGCVVLVADGGGAPLVSRLPAGGEMGEGMERVVLLVGPEGGWSDREREMFKEVGASIVSFGRTIMRIETAAVVGAALIGQVCQREESSVE